MKISRLIGILSILVQKEKVTAPYLADKFEVSRRTINRDIEDLCMAGIPVITTQGQNGGISIMEGYRMDKTLLTSSEMQAILTGLKSLDSVSGTNRYQQLMDKLFVGSSSVLESNHYIRIDLSSWYKSNLSSKITLIQEAIEQRKRIQFTYYAPSGQTKRTLEAYYLIFQWASWYVWGYCLKRQAYRMFKLNRIQELIMTTETYEPQSIMPPDISSERIYPERIMAEAVFVAEMKWRLVEEFGMESFQEQPDGTLLFRGGFTSKESLFGWLLSFQNQVELKEPEELREEFLHLLTNIATLYKK